MAVKPYSFMAISVTPYYSLQFLANQIFLVNQKEGEDMSQSCP